MSKFEILRKNILNISTNKYNFEIAKTEWVVERTNKSESPETCLCSKRPIFNLCYIKNIYNDNLALVGNCCVKHFGYDYDWYFDGIKRLKKDLRPTGKFIIYLFKIEMINEWEFKFLSNRENSKKGSIKQKESEKKIINKLKYKFYQKTFKAFH